MTKVKFLMDYRGKLTGEQFYQEGETAEFEEAVAAELVERKRAKYASLIHPKKKDNKHED